MSISLNHSFRRKGKIFVPESIVQTLQDFCTTYAPDTEFGMMFKAAYQPELATAVILPDEVFLPHQSVTGAFFTAHEAKEGFNAICHRHPDGVDRFSGYDWQDINRQFKISFLFLNGKRTPDGMIHIPMPENEILQLSCDVVQVAYNGTPFRFKKKEVNEKVERNYNPGYEEV